MERPSFLVVAFLIKSSKWSLISYLFGICDSGSAEVLGSFAGQPQSVQNPTVNGLAESAESVQKTHCEEAEQVQFCATVQTGK